MSPASSETVTVNAPTNNGTAVAGSDHTAAVSSTLTFNPAKQPNCQRFRQWRY
ncbi:MAG: hypothetical protein H6667_26010 [Ardenticatenaceae bacterium]|nr:hypothetical protein [Ardenticatenaceae bacterium]